MSENKSTTPPVSSIEAELYFLIARFLSNGPCKQTADVLLQELGEHELLPKGIDWKGNERIRSYDQLVQSNRHIGADYLLQLCSRVGPLLDQLVPSNIHGIRSLLGAGNLSLLRTPESVKFTKWGLGHHMALHHGCPRVPPHNLAVPSLVQMFHARRASGACVPIPSSMYSKVTMHDRKLGHLSAVYCVSYDRTGNYIFTGADDALVKIWDAHSGRLLATLRGHSSEITDMAVNYENTLLASGSCDKMVRVWCLRTKAPVAVLHGHTGAINTLQFGPQCRGDTRILMSAGADGCVCFWLWNASMGTFSSKPKKFVERSHAGAQMLCASFSPGGVFLATGNSDHVIRVYFLHAQAAEKICELEAHTNKVDSMCYSNNHNLFVSGSEDGTARIWRYERQEWRAIVLNMTTRLHSDGTEVIRDGTGFPADRLRVTMVCWNMDDSLVITAVSDFSIKVWEAHTGKLLHVLQAHQDEVFVLEGSPTDRRIVVSAGHDGNIIIWDVVSGVKIKSFFNNIQGQGYGAVYDCKFTPDGQSFAATDSHGHLLFFGFGANDKIKQVPQEVFFHTDYRPLIRDANNYVLDEQTQQPPHLMPPPFLVNIDGNPYPPHLQRLVPGRENLKDQQLVPEIGINEAGNSEVIGDGAGQPDHHVPDPHHRPEQNGIANGDETEEEGEAGSVRERVRPSIDEMIRQLQREQDERILAEGGDLPLASPPPPDQRRPSSSIEGMVGMRRSGATEGVRQSLENVTQHATSSDLAAWRKRVMIRGLDKGVLKSSEDRRMAFADEEIRKFIIERKKKPSVPNTPSTLFGQMSKSKQAACKTETLKKERETEHEVTARNRLTTRALYDTEEEEEETELEDNFDRDSDSGEYSDWIMEGSSNLQPPKRRSQRRPKRKRVSSSEDEEEEEEEELVMDEEDDDDDDDDDDDHEDYKLTLKPISSKKEEPKDKTKKKALVPKGKGKSKKPYKPKVVPKVIPKVTELREEFRPPEWLTGTIPRKTPYVPQMGDEVMYFRQGHELYLEAVKRHKAYELNPTAVMPWEKMPLREMELVKIVGIRYEVKPPRLCNLKLAFINPDTGKMTGRYFSIRYHDMPDVIDFLVLRQHFDIAFKRRWKPGDRFRSMIDDQWWMGVIESQSPLNPLFPDSHFQSLYVHWDNGEYERLSPWDMEPVNENLVPSDVGGGVPVDNEELKDLLYTPKPGEWSSVGREVETERILHGIEQVMEHSAAEPFNAPVDLNAFPEYGIVIEYPIDLSTIKARLENGYYRRINALQWDIRHVESNAKKFNEDGTSISRSASIITDTLLRFIGDKECRDPMPILERLSRGVKFHWGNDNATHSSSDEASTSTGGSKRKRGDEVDESGPSTKRHCTEDVQDPLDWKERCWELLGTMLECEDAQPFKEPVNTQVYPDYTAIIEHPMDFGTVACHLQSDHYKTPLDFAEDVRLIFSNSRLYNPNKRSRIYSMTIRLSAMFEERMRKILTSYRSATKSRQRTSWTSSNRHVSSSAAAEQAKQFAEQVKRAASASNLEESQSSRGEPSTSRGSSSRREEKAKSRSSSPSKKRARIEDDTDDENTEVEDKDDEDDSDDDSDDDTEEEEENGDDQDTAPKSSRLRKADASSDKENYNEDEDTEVEEEEEDHNYSAPSRKARSRGAAKSASDKRKMSNGHQTYRTRAKTGSLKPKRYMSSEDEDEKDTRTRKNTKRAESLSSRDSSVHFPDDEEEEESTESSSGSASESDSATEDERDHRSSRHHKSKSRRKVRSRSKKANHKRHRHSESLSEEASESEESSESDSDSDSDVSDKPPPRRAPPPKPRAGARKKPPVNYSGSSKNHTSSFQGTRTTRNQGKRTVHYLEDSDDDYLEDATHTTVSSRGRVRKMTKRARALHND